MGKILNRLASLGRGALQDRIDEIGAIGVITPLDSQKGDLDHPSRDGDGLWPNRGMPADMNINCRRIHPPLDDGENNPYIITQVRQRGPE